MCEIETIEGVRIPNLYRLTVDPSDPLGWMRVAFVEAENEAQAREIVAAVVALIDRLELREAASLVCNVRLASELIREGLSDDLLHRLFEIRGAAIYEHPVFLLANPGALTKKWAERMARKNI